MAVNQVVTEGKLAQLACALAVKGTTEAEAIGKIKQAAESHAVTLSDQEAKTLLEHACIEIRPWSARTLTDAVHGETQEPPWVIKGLLLEQSATLVSAQPHSIKSFSWLAAAMQAVAKHKVWGHFECPNVERTLFIETEDPLYLVEARIRGLAAGHQLEALPGFTYIRRGPFDLVRDEQTLRLIISHYNPDFVVLSTLQNILGGRNLLQQVDMAPVSMALMRLAEASPLIVLTHSPWNPRMRRAAGTVTLPANFATSLHYEKVEKEGSTYAKVTIDSKAGSAETQFHLKVESEGRTDNPSSVRNIVYGSGWPRGSKTQEILKIVQEDPTIQPKDIAEQVGCSARHVRKVLDVNRKHDATTDSSTAVSCADSAASAS